MSSYGEFYPVYYTDDGSVRGNLIGRPVVLLLGETLSWLGAQLEPGASISVADYLLTLVGPAANGGGLWEVRVTELEAESEGENG